MYGVYVESYKDSDYVIDNQNQYWIGDKYALINERLSYPLLENRFTYVKQFNTYQEVRLYINRMENKPI